MIKKQNRPILVKGPPGLVVRKSRDSLRMFGVRGDPEHIGKGNLTGFEHLSGLKSTVDCFAYLLWPRNGGQTTTASSLRATEGSVVKLVPLLQATDGSVAISQQMKMRILNRVQDIKKKDYVRVEVDSKMFPENWSKLGFHRAPGMMKRNLTGFQSLSGLIPTIDYYALLRRPRNDGQTSKSSLRATEEGMASCLLKQVQDDEDGKDEKKQILKQIQDDKKDFVRMEVLPMAFLRN